MTAEKRPLEEGEASDCKVLKIDDEALLAVQKELNDLDAKCREDQIEVQCKYEKMKAKHYHDRGEIFKKIPQFWKTVIVNFAGSTGLVLEEEIPVLEHLADVKLEDNLDKAGSHKFTFTFNENKYFKETELVKELKVKEDESVEVKVTPITWTEDPLKDIDGGDEVQSFFKWLQSTEEDTMGDFGSVFRETIWEEALDVYQNPPVEFDCEEGEDEEQEEGEEEEGDEDEEE